MTTGTTQRTDEHWIGRTSEDRHADNVHLDTDTGRPEWLAVHTGMSGMDTNLVPIAGSSPRDDGDLVLAVEKDTVQDAPKVGAGEERVTDTEKVRADVRTRVEVDGDVDRR